MNRFWGWVAYFSARRLGYSSWVPVNIDGTNYALLLLPDGVTAEDLAKAVEDSQGTDVPNKGENE